MNRFLRLIDALFNGCLSLKQSQTISGASLDSSSGFEVATASSGYQGKAGAGKLTLMKFLSDDPRTPEAVDHWGKFANADVVLAKFFFWNSGTDMQKSIKGLLQSVMHEILRKCPSLIPIIASSRWSQIDLQSN